MTNGRADPAVPFPPPSARSGWRRRSGELARRANELAQRGSELLAGGPAGEVDRDDPGRAAEVIWTLTWLCIERLREHPPPAEVSEGICHLVCDLQQLARELSEHEMASRTRRIAACEAGLARLRAISTCADLIDRAAVECTRSCGFERALLSKVENGYWTPWVEHFNRTEGMEQWLSDWKDNPIPLSDTMLETRLLTERRPALVHDTDAPQIHPIVREASCRSYVVAPVMPGGEVVGFFHVDHGASARRCDQTDRDVLWAFAEGFGHIYERTALLERLRSQREGVRAVLTSVSSAMSALNDAELELAAQPDHQYPVTRTAVSVLTTMSSSFDDLTPRELQVLELLVSGARNQTIAEQLVITEDTVKAHVKHILRKVGAANRSQAIAQYLNVFGDAGS